MEHSEGKHDDDTLVRVDSTESSHDEDQAAKENEGPEEAEIVFTHLTTEESFGP